MGVRSSVEIWVGFEGEEQVSQAVNEAGFDQEEDECDWETPTEDTVWTCIYGHDEETLVGFGVQIVSSCPQENGKISEKLDLDGIESRAKAAKTVLVNFLEERQVPDSLIKQIDIWISPQFG